MKLSSAVEGSLQPPFNATFEKEGEAMSIHFDEYGSAHVTYELLKFFLEQAGFEEV